MWNPFGDIHKDWISSVSRWGNAKVVMFYAYLWIAIGFNGYRIYEPMSFGWSCLVRGQDSDAAVEWMTMLMRQWSVFVCAWGIVQVQSRSTLQSLQMCFITGVAALAVLWVNMESAPDQVCFSRVNATWPLTVGWPFLALVCGYVEDRIAESSNGIDRSNVGGGQQQQKQPRRWMMVKRQNKNEGSDSSSVDTAV